MASSGLSRRRVGNASNMDGDDGPSPASSAPPTPTPGSSERQRQSGGTAFEGSGKVAFDARDMDLANEALEGGKMPRLTIMEEVLLLGLKDRAVRIHSSRVPILDSAYTSHLLNTSFYSRHDPCFPQQWAAHFHPCSTAAHA
jgi:hypothetical protein